MKKTAPSGAKLWPFKGLSGARAEDPGAVHVREERLPSWVGFFLGPHKDEEDGAVRCETVALQGGFLVPEPRIQVQFM